MAKKFMLVYQAGIANLFEVRSLNLSDYGRDAKRVYQGDFNSARMMARGAGLAGATVHTAACNRAGDIAKSRWTTDLAAQPFCHELVRETWNAPAPFPISE